VADIENDIAATHLRVCDRFGEAVTAADGHWDALSPCPEWDARAVVEHVIGFHDAMLLRPLDAKPDRPPDDTQRRWTVTVEALRDVFQRPGLFDGVVEIPATGDTPATQLDARGLVPAFSTDVLVHTWDLARAVGADDRLDPELCAHFYAQLTPELPPGIFEPPVPVSDDADAQSRLLARMGRNPI
jgi:uncharacterized protein (TIGR03086 family)